MLIIILECVAVPIHEYLHFGTSAHIVSITAAHQYIISTAHVLQFIYAALAVRERFKLLGKFLLVINLKMKVFKYKSFDEVEYFEKLYHNLCDVISLINSSMTFHLIVASALGTVSYTFGAYGTIFAYLINVDFWGVFIRDGIWSITQLLIIAFMAHYANSTTSEGEKLKVEVSRVASTYKHQSEFRVRLQSCLDVINQRNLKFKTIFFTIDWKHFLSMLSLALTYLVITIQFELANKVKR
jgi:hypothetical protein